MKRVVTALLATTMLAGAASAADMAVKARPAPMIAPVDQWTGFYIGGNIGYGVGTSDVVVSQTAIGPPPPFNFISANAIDHSVAGVSGGIQGGYNWMLNPTWLVGIEADFQWADQEGRGNVTVFGNSYAGTQSLNWFGTVRGRIGPIVGNTLWYVTGGFAYGEREARESVSTLLFVGGPLLATGGRTVSDTVSGWTVGVGAETKLTTNWSVKLEYLFMDLDSISNGFGINNVPPFGTALVATSASTADFNNHVARIGVNYKF